MASTVITPVADALATVLAGVVADPPLNVEWDTTSTNGRWAPRSLAATPAVVIDIPSVRRTDLNAAETALGSDDWFLSFPLRLYVDLADAGRDQQRIVELLELVIDAVDANRTLGLATVDDSKITTGDPAFDLTDQARPLLTYDCEVQVYQRVPHT